MNVETVAAELSADTLADGPFARSAGDEARIDGVDGDQVAEEFVRGRLAHGSYRPVRRSS